MQRKVREGGRCEGKQRGRGETQGGPQWKSRRDPSYHTHNHTILSLASCILRIRYD